MCRKEGVLMPVNVNEIEPDEKIVEIEMERLREFRNHPFKVKADGQMLCHESSDRPSSSGRCV